MNRNEVTRAKRNIDQLTSYDFLALVILNGFLFTVKKRLICRQILGVIIDVFQRTADVIAVDFDIALKIRDNLAEKVDVRSDISIDK